MQVYFLGQRMHSLLSSHSSVIIKPFNLPRNGTEKQPLPPHCQWSQSENQAHWRSSCRRFSVWSQQGTVNSREAGQRCLGEYRRDAGSLVSPRCSGASTSISHTGKLPPSYLIPFILGFMNSHACKSEHMHVGNRKVKTHIAVDVTNSFNLGDFWHLLKYCT